MGGVHKDRQIRIKELTTQRIKGMSSASMLRMLEDEGYDWQAARRMLNETQKIITEMQDKKADDAYTDAIARLEELYESTKDKKLKLRIQSELCKLQGLNKPQKLDVTTNGENININEINIHIINDKDELQED